MVKNVFLQLRLCFLARLPKPEEGLDTQTHKEELAKRPTKFN